MRFLLNDTILDLAEADLSLAEAENRYRRLSLEFVGSLGAELFAEDPRLQVTDPARARRLAVMIAAVSPGVNAAMFAPMAQGCPPDEVETGFESLSPAMMDGLSERQCAGRLTGAVVDTQVWRRLAA